MMILARCVAVGPLYDSLFPPTVMQMKWVLSLLGLTNTTIRPYVNLLPAGTAGRRMKKIVFPPLMSLPTPCSSLPM